MNKTKFICLCYFLEKRLGLYLEKSVDKYGYFVYNVYIRYNERRRELHDKNS